MSKRSCITISSHHIKKQCNEITESNNDKSAKTEKLTPTHSALLTIRNLFPCKRFYNKLPPIIMLHQIYDLISSRTTVDREIKLLQNNGKICIFKLGVEVLARAVILTQDLIETANICFPDNTLVEKYLKFIIPLGVIDIDKKYLEQTFTAKEISELMHCGFLIFSNESNYLLSFPNAGQFMKAYTKGRKSILQIVKKSKHGEILQYELEGRNLEKTVALGITYHIHDVVGADLIKSIDTTSGSLLRWNNATKI